jgi:hypothetical protein
MKGGITMMPKMNGKAMKIVGVVMAVGSGLFAFINALADQKDAEKLDELWEEHRKNKNEDEEAH